MRATFDPRLPIARPRVVPLPAPRVFAHALLEDLEDLDASPQLRSLGEAGELVVEFDSLGDEAHAARLATLVATLQRRGLVVHGAFTLGYDHDDEGCFARLVAWVEAQGLAEVELRLWTPTPGSEEARDLARAGRLRHLDFARWDGAHVIVEPAGMAPETLQRGWAWASRRLASLRSILRRRPSVLGLRQVLAMLTTLALSWPPRSTRSDADAAGPAQPDRSPATHAAHEPWAPTARRSAA